MVGVRFGAVPLAGVILVTFALIAVGASGMLADGRPSGHAAALAVPLGTTILTNCTESALASAVALGGTVQYGANCPDVLFTAPIGIGPKLTVSIVSGGYNVLLDGQSSTQLFIVSGGHLSITGLKLGHGFIGGSTGSSGNPGQSGASGSYGSSGSAGSSGGGSGGAGQNGGKATAGKPGTAGKAGAPARGGAIWIKKGVVVLTGDTFLTNR
ncbi:MAG: hypothetical protein ACHQ2Y_08165, partial [Candidatus Lutacidiplasmatales archaeon]